MSVLKSKRKASQFEVFHQLTKLRKDITDLLLRDFGYSYEKCDKKPQKAFGGRTYDQLTEAERLRYDRMKQKCEAFDDWFIYDQRQVIVDCLREITKEVYVANSIYPTCMEELIERRLHQDNALGQCYRLVQELQYAIETLPVDVNIFTQFGNAIQTEINLIKGWRKADNKFKGAISTSAANFANVNNNGNANYNKLSSMWRFLQIQYSLTETGRVIQKINPKRLTCMRRKMKKLVHKLSEKQFEDWYQSWFCNHYRVMSNQQRDNLNALYKELKEVNYHVHTETG